MYTFIKNKLFIWPVLLILLITTGYNSLEAANSFSLKPIRPPGLSRIARFLGRAQRSLVLDRIDALISATGFYDLIAAANMPKVTVIAPVINKRQKEKDDTVAIKALSINMLLFPVPFFFNQAQRIAAFARSARQLDPDIIFLQEVWDNNSLALLIAAFPGYYSIYTAGIGYNYSGLLILSRFPAKKASAKRFAVSLKHNVEELIAQKGFILVETTIRGQPFYLLNTHLYSADRSKLYRPNLVQFSRVADIVENLPAAAIIGGDMNLIPADLEARIPDDIVRDNCDLSTAGYPKPTQKLDYIMVRPHHGKTATVNSRRIDAPLRFSDHTPIYAEIYFR
ncbi:MAG: endonuclease/exonuclease/phosphatase family protein [Candidatus Riflebacteria bacterium]|nr:endonuclease/exonuclease/phosphatase family protein [Candidatus Riflebacteria bacterium]